MSSERWLHDSISGAEAGRLLLGRGSDGSYLVRPSSTQGCYALSVRKGGEVFHCKIKHAGGMYEICKGYRFENLIELIQYYKANQNVLQGVFGRQVRLKDPLSPDPEDVNSDHEGLPQNWNPNVDYDKVKYVRVDVDAGSAEYINISTNFQKTMPSSKFKISRIERIQNPILWKKYELHRKSMKSDSGGRVEEAFLFHGTNPDVIQKIVQNNFDWRICGKNGTCYGEGSYFARDAKYSHGYTDSSQIEKSMFAARILIGKYTKGESGYKKPPPVPGDPNGKHYDSCVNNIADPEIYVIFDFNQIYPEYLIHYTVKNT